MDSNYPTTKIKEEVKNNDEAEDTPGIKVEQKDPDYEADHESIRFEEVKMKVEGESSISTMEYMGIEDKKEACDIAPLTDEKEIKVETDEADYVTYDMLKKIKDEPNTDQWDELNPAMDAAEHVKKEEPAAVAVKVEGVDSTKTEEMDTTELTEEVDIKPDDDGGVDSAVNQKYWGKGLGVGHREAEGESFICHTCNYIAHSKSDLMSHFSADSCILDTNVNKSSSTQRKSQPSNLCVCTKCDKEFSRKISLDDHIIRTHAELIPSLSCNIYVCTTCPYKTALKRRMDRHLLVHPGPSSREINNCIHCGATYKNKQNLHDHIIKKHPNFTASVTSKIHTCSECTFKTTDKTKLVKHLFNHPGAASKHKLGSSCMYCDDIFRDKITLDEHIIRKHPDYISSVTSKVHECSDCEYKTVKKSHLDGHVLSLHPDAASGSNFRTCVHCNKIFRSAQVLDDHILRKHPSFSASVASKIYECSTCTFKTTRPNELDRHLLVHSQVNTCVHCNMKFKNKTTRDNHMIRHHPDYMTSVTSEIYECPKCAYKTTIKNRLDDHVKAHSDATSSSMFYTCIHCGASFKKKQTLDNHIIREHPNFIASIKRTIHQCPNCTYKTTTASELGRHLRAHGAVPIFELSTCEHCNTSFKRKESLDNHIIREHSTYISSVTSKIYECSNCSYKTTIKSKFNKHVSVHQISDTS